MISQPPSLTKIWCDPVKYPDRYTRFQDIPFAPHTDHSSLRKFIHNKWFHCNNPRHPDQGRCFLSCLGDNPPRQFPELINAVNKGILCWACLGPFSEDGPPSDTKTGLTCSHLCEEWIWTHVLNDNLNNSHDLRTAWANNINQNVLANTNLKPSCNEHPNFFTCMFDTVNANCLMNMIDNPANNLTARRKRRKKAKIKGDPLPLPTHLEEIVYDIYAGLVCPGKDCLKRLNNPMSPPPGSFRDTVLDLHYCSLKCLNSWDSNLTEYHKDKNRMVLECISTKYNLILDFTIKPPRVSPLTRYRRHLERKDDPPPRKKSQTPLVDSQLIVSYNIRGNCNLPHVKGWVKNHKPAIIALQELKMGSSKAKALFIPGYVVKGFDPDTCIAVRNDLKILDSGTHKVPFSNCFVKIQGPEVTFTVTNVYVRDKELTLGSLDLLENFSLQHIILGDFNAKHPEILPHTQRIRINDNGRTLLRYRAGLISGIPTGYKIENIDSIDEYTHMSPEGRTAQIDLIMSSPDTQYRLGPFKYLYDLCTDHIAIATTASGLVNPLFKVDPPKIIYDWENFDRESFKRQMHELMLNPANNWAKDDINELCEKLENYGADSLQSHLPRKSINRKRPTLPIHLVSKIKEKRRLMARVTRANAEMGLWLRHKENTNAGIITPPNLRPSWSEARTLNEYNVRNPARRHRIMRIRKSVSESFKDRGLQRLKKQLEKLADIPFFKASKAWWAAMRKIKAGKSPKTMAPIKWNGIWATEQQDIANLIAEYAKHNFVPLSDPKFDSTALNKIKEEFAFIKEKILDPDTPPSLTHISTSLPTQQHPYRKQPFTEEEEEYTPPKLTPHQKQHLPSPGPSDFKSRKTSLPGAQTPNVPIDEDWVPRDIQDTDPVSPPFTMFELNRAIYKQPRKAPGIDGIYSDVFKNLTNECKQCLLTLYNRIKDSGRYPDRWKIAVVVMILKKNKPPDNPKSYRPISLLALAGKIFETMLLERLSPYMEGRNLIPSYQTGFRKKKSTMINLQRFMNGSYLAATRATHPSASIMLLLDCLSAFDTVPHEGVIVKACRDGLSVKTIRLMHSWLSGRRLRIRVSDSISHEVPIGAGVPQGSVLSPLIWDYWVGDCPTPDSPHVQTSMYADDMALIATHPRREKNAELMQNEIFRVADWANAKGIKMVISKTQLLVTHPDSHIREEVKSHTFHLHRDLSEPIAWCNTACFLGITFAETGSFEPHFKSKLASAHAKIRQLRTFVGTIDKHLLFRVYKGAIEPTVLYGTEVLYPVFSDMCTKKFLNLEFQAIRMAYNVSYEDRLSNADLHLMKEKPETIWDRIEKRRENFLLKNFANVSIRYSELSVTGEGRPLRFRDKYSPPNVKGWRAEHGWHDHRPITLFIDTEKLSNSLHNYTAERKAWKRGTLLLEDATRFPPSIPEEETQEGHTFPASLIPPITLRWSDKDKTIISKTPARSTDPSISPSKEWREHAKHLPRKFRKKNNLGQKTVKDARASWTKDSPLTIADTPSLTNESSLDLSHIQDIQNGPLQTLLDPKNASAPPPSRPPRLKSPPPIPQVHQPSWPRYKPPHPHSNFYESDSDEDIHLDSSPSSNSKFDVQSPLVKGRLKDTGFQLSPSQPDTPADGSCQFWALADQFNRTYNSTLAQADVREIVTSHICPMISNNRIIWPESTDKLMAWIADMNKPGVHGDEVSLQIFANYSGHDIVYIPMHQESAHHHGKFSIIRTDSPLPSAHPLFLLYFEESRFGTGHYQSVIPVANSITLRLLNELSPPSSPTFCPEDNVSIISEEELDPYSSDSEYEDFEDLEPPPHPQKYSSPSPSYSFSGENEMERDEPAAGLRMPFPPTSVGSRPSYPWEEERLPRSPSSPDPDPPDGPFLFRPPKCPLLKDIYEPYSPKRPPDPFEWRSAAPSQSHHIVDDDERSPTIPPNHQLWKYLPPASSDATPPKYDLPLKGKIAIRGFEASQSAHLVSVRVRGSDDVPLFLSHMEFEGLFGRKGTDIAPSTPTATPSPPTSPASRAEPLPDSRTPPQSVFSESRNVLWDPGISYSGQGLPCDEAPLDDHPEWGGDRRALSR